MKLVAVCRVRNEADIIEAFVRHHCVYFRKLIILDDGSSDETLRVLRSLQAEGLPLVVLFEQAIAYEQSRYMTLLMRLAVDQFGADWVMPLDADEFIEPRPGMTLMDALAGHEPRLFSLQWNNFVWTPESKDSEPNPVLRLRLRLPPRPDCPKVLVPARLVDDKVHLRQGNHELVRAGKLLPVVPLDTIKLCHFPIRDPLQYADKIAIGYLKYAAMAGWMRDFGFHYIEPFHTLLAGGPQALEERMSADSRSYSLAGGAEASEQSDARDAPLRYMGGPLKFSPSRPTLLSNVLQHAEAIAKELATSARVESMAAETEIAGGAAAIQSSQQFAEEKAALKVRLSKLEIELRAARNVIQIQSERLSSRTFRLLDRLYSRLTRAGLSPRAIADAVFWLLRIK